MNRKALLCVSLILMFMFGLMFIAFYPVVVRASSVTRLYLEDAVTKLPVSIASPGETFTMNLRVENVRALFGWGVYMRWTGSVLNVTEITEGDFLKIGGETFPTFKMFNEPDSAGYSDYVIMINTLLAALKGVEGSGILATITFLVETEGETTIDLFITDLIDDQTGTIIHTVEDAYFSVTPPTLSVVPTVIEDPYKVAGEYFTINITISDVTDLYKFEFKLRYDLTLLNATELTISPFLNEPTQVLHQEIDREVGRIWVGVNSTAAVPVSGNGTLASITFQVLTIGEGVLDLYDTRIRDELSESIQSIYDIGGDHNPPAVDGYFNNKPASHDIAVTGLLVYPRSVTVGESVAINVTITNAGGYTETFDVSISYDGNVIETQTDITLEAKANRKVEFTWVTTDVTPGDYHITAYVSEIPDDKNTANNQLVDTGKVTVEAAPGPGVDIMLYAVAGVVVVIVVAVLFYFFKMRKPKK